jgi:hypothetical protein
MSREMSFFMEGRLIVIERFEDETDPSFAERSTFILYFRNDPLKYAEAKRLSFHHVTKMFQGVTYNTETENQLKQYRDEAKRLKEQLSA